MDTRLFIFRVMNLTLTWKLLKRTGLHLTKELMTFDQTNECQLITISTIFIIFIIKFAITKKKKELRSPSLQPPPFMPHRLFG